IRNPFQSVNEGDRTFARILSIRRGAQDGCVGPVSCPEEYKIGDVARDPPFTIGACFHQGVSGGGNSILKQRTCYTIRFGSIGSIADDGTRQTMMQNNPFVWCEHSSLVARKRRVELQSFIPIGYKASLPTDARMFACQHLCL